MWRGKNAFFASLALCGLGFMLLGAQVSAQISDPAAGVDNIAPAAVADLTATADLGGTSVTLAWGLSPSDAVYQQSAGGITAGGTFVNTNDVAGYQIWRQSADGVAVVIDTVAAGTAEYVDAAAVSGIIYTYGVTAVDASGNASEAVYAPAVSLGPPPDSSTDLPDPIKRVRITLFGDMPGNLLQFRADFAAIIAHLLGISPSRIRIIDVRSGSIIVDLEIVDANSDSLSTQLAEMLAADPDLIANTAADLGLDTEFGTVLAQSTFSGTNLDFGAVDAAAPATQTITMTNNASDPEAVLVVSTQITGTGFSVDPAALTVVAGAGATLTVTFDPAEVGGLNGTYAGVLVITTNDPNAMETVVALSATVTGGTEPQAIALSSAALSFGQVAINTADTLAIVIRNLGDLELSGTIALAGDPAFATDAAAAFAIAGGDSAIVAVGFAPTDTAAYAAVLTISSNDLDEGVIMVAVTGIGVETVVLLLPEDFNGDNTVGLDDFFLFADNFGLRDTMPAFNPRFDLDTTGDVGLSDFFLFADRFGYSLVNGNMLNPAGQIVTP